MRVTVAKLVICAAAALPLPAQQTVVEIHGWQFTLNRQPTYTAAGGFANADPNLAGRLLNVRAVQATFDDANYPNQGARANPYQSKTMAAGAFDYPGGKWDP